MKNIYFNLNQLASKNDGGQSCDGNRQSRLMLRQGKRSENGALSSTCLRSASDALSFRSRYLRYAAMIFCVLAMSVANIGTAWGANGDATSKYLNVSNYSTLATTLSYTSGHYYYYVGDSVLVILPSAYSRYGTKSGSEQNWCTPNNQSWTSNKGWSAPSGSVFKGNLGYNPSGNAAALSIKGTASTPQCFSYRITNCTKVQALINSSNASRTVTLTVYPVTGVNYDTRGAAVGTDSDKSNSVKILKVDGLSASTVYEVFITSNSSSESLLYELAFFVPSAAPACTARTFKSGEKIFFKDASGDISGISAKWKAEGKNIYAYFWNDTEYAWSTYGDLVSGSWNAANAIYEFTVPDSGKEYTKVLFTRGTAASWDGKEHQTSDQTPCVGENMYVQNTSAAVNGKYNGSWSKYAPTQALIGDFNDWDPDQGKFVDGRVILDLEANTDYEFKVLVGDGTVNTNYWSCTACAKATNTVDPWQQLYANQNNWSLRSGEAGEYCFHWDNTNQQLGIYYPQARLTKKTYLYFNGNANTAWNAKDPYHAKFSYKYYDTGGNHSDLFCANDTSPESHIYYTAVPNNDYIGRVQVMCMWTDHSAQHYYANTTYASGRTSTKQNCLVAPAAGSDGINLTWGTYCPPMSSVTLTHNAGTTTTYGGNGAKATPYIVEVSTSINVSASSSSSVADGNMTAKYNFKDVTASKQDGEGTTFTLTASSTDNTTHKVNVDAYNYYNSTSSTVLGSDTIYYLAKTIYAITYKCGSKSTGDDIVDHKIHGTNITLRGNSTFSREGYNLVGWATTDGEDEEHDVGATYSTNAALTLYPVWEAKTTTVTLNANTSNHGSGDNQSVTATYDSALPEFTPTTAAEGWHLVGYYTGETSGDKIINANGTFNANSGIWNRTDGATLTLYAHYEINTYTVNFASNNDSYGTVDVASITGVTHGSTVSIASNVLTLKATNVTATATTSTAAYTYAFSGWSVDNGDAITDNTTITATFTATAKTYDVDFSLTNAAYSSGTDEGEDVATYGTNYSVTFAATSGYSFPSDITVQIGGVTKTKGTHYTWNSSTGALVVTGSYITGDIAISFAAIEDALHVTYDGDSPTSGSAPEDDNSYDVDDEVTVLGDNSMSKTGYTFRGWSDGTTFFLPGQKFTITDNVTLTAVWDAGSAGNCSLADIDFTDETTASLTDGETKTVDDVSLYFKGYSSITNGTGAVTSNNMSTNNGYIAIPLSGVNGAISFTLTGVDRPQFKYYVNTTGYDAIPSPIGYPGEPVTITRPASGTAYVTVSDISITKSYAVLYVGQGSSSNPIKTISVTTPCTVSSGYKVTFDKGSGPSTVTGMPDDIEGVPSGLKILKPATDPTATGYTFDKWVTTSGGSTPFDFANTTITTDKTIYASWTANTYNVSLTLTDDLATKKSGSTGTNAATYGTDHTLTFEAKSGYALPSDVTVTIGGEDATKGTEYSWSISDGVGTLIIDGSYILGNIAITVTAEVAKADPEVYTVSGTTSVCEGDEATITLSDSESGVTYHLYKGEDDQDDDKVGDGNEITWTVTAVGTYTVKVEEDEDYNAADMDGNAVISYKTATSIDTDPATAVTGHDGVNFTLGSGMEASGQGTLTYKWYSYTSSGGAGKAVVAGATEATYTTSKSAGTYYYKVEVTAACGSVESSMITVTIDNKHKLTYDANGGSGAPDAEYRAAGSAALSATEPTRTNYRFLGWNTEDDGTGDHYDAGASYTMGSSAVTLYAEWGETATLTWTLTTGTGESSVSTSNKTSTNSTRISTSNMSNLSNSGLTITNNSKTSYTVKIEAPSSKDNDKYMYVTFVIADDYELIPSAVTATFQPVDAAASADMILSDTHGHSISLLGASCSKGSANEKTITNGSSVAFSGTVTLKIYCYGSSVNTYRLGSTISIAGDVNYVCPARATITSPTAPQSIKLYTDQSKTLTVAATAYSSGTLHYQWKKDGVNIVGATSASHTVYGSIDGTAGETYVYTCDVTQTSPDACATVTSPAVSITFASTSCGYTEIASAVLTSKTAATLNNATLLVSNLGDISSGSCKLNGKGAYFGLQLASGSFEVGDSIEFKIKKNDGTEAYIFATTDTTGLQTTDAIYTATSLTSGDNIIKFIVTSGTMLTKLNTTKKIAIVRRTKNGVLNQNHSVYYVKVKRYGCPDIFIYDDAAATHEWSDDDNWIGPAGHGSGLPTSDDRIFINKSVTVDVATASAAEMHITNGSMVTVEKSITVGDVIIETGSTLNIAKDGDDGITVATNSLYLKGGWNSSYTSYDMPRVYIDPASTLTKEVETVNLDISVDSRNYYPIAVPFRVKVSDVDYANSTLASFSNYGANGQYVIKDYDGARRAENGPDQVNNWKVVPQEDKGNDVYLEPGRGYILTAVSLPSYGGGVIRFPMSFTNAWTAEGEQGTVDAVTKNVVAVTAYSGAATAGDKKVNKGWNLLGVPFMSCYTTSDDMGTSVVMQGKFNFDDGTWDGEDTHRYVNVPVHDFSEYVQVDMEDEETPTVLRPGWCFFVQIGTTGSLTFLTEDEAQSSSLPIYAPKRTTGMPTVKTGIILSGAEASDKTTILVSDKYSAADYEINADLEKLFGNGYTLATYSLSGSTRLAYNAMSNTDAANVIPIGYRAPAEGEYTFSINPRYAANEAFESVNLIDYETGVVTDLMMYSYTFTTDRTQNDSRFAINVVKRQDMPTDVENVQGVDVQDTKVRKLILDDKLYIIRDGKMYDATGKKLK